MKRLFSLFLCGYALVLWCAAGTSLTAQAPGAAAASAPGAPGRAQAVPPHLVYTQNCTFCHGPDARGGAEGGPDLTRSALVASFTNAPALNEFLKVGRPPKMPAFNLTDDQAAEILAFVRSQAAPARGRAPQQVVIVGDAKAGEAFYNGAGKCSSCHSVTKDLKGIGSRYPSLMLEGRIALPRGSGGYPGLSFGPASTAPEFPRVATITPASGPAVSGTIVYISDFYVTVQDASGASHTFLRNGATPKVEVKDPLQGHFELMKTLTDKDLHDVLAYLVTLK